MCVCVCVLAAPAFCIMSLACLWEECSCAVVLRMSLTGSSRAQAQDELQPRLALGVPHACVGICNAAAIRRLKLCGGPTHRHLLHDDPRPEDGSSPDQAREAEAQGPFARVQGGVRAVEGWHVYVESRRAYAETVVAQPGSPTCGESHYANTGCIASAEAAATSAQFASHARIRHARLGK